MNLSKQLLGMVMLPLLVFSVLSCKKDDVVPDPIPVPEPPPVEVPVVQVNDPSTANTMGFFVDDWKPKTFAVPTFTESAVPAKGAVSVTVDASSVITKIPLSVFGHNAVWWMGPPTPQAATDIKNLHPHILRYPGGNSANNFFWNALQDKLPADAPTTHIDADGKSFTPGYNYGMSDHNWEFSLQKYYDLLQQTGNQGIISVNYSYARYGTSANPVAVAAHLAADWVRYDNGRTKYWELGNENYGNWQSGYRIDVANNKDGQPEFITGQLYAKHSKIFIDSMQKAATEIGKKIYIGVVAHESPATESWQTATTKNWNSGMMAEINNKADFYVAHNYFTGTDNVNATNLMAAAASVPAVMSNFITGDLKKFGATVKPIAFDEWNMFAAGSKQAVSNVSGMFAVVVMGEVLKNKYGMAARWDLLNGWGGTGDDHGLFSAGDEPDGIPKWNPRPAFYYMYFFQKMLGDRLIPTTVAGSTTIKAYASTYSTGEANVTLVNTSATAQIVELKFTNFNAGPRFYWYNLEGGTDNGEFSRKVLVNGTGPTLVAGGPLGYETLKARSAVTTGGVIVTVPGRGAVIMAIDKK